MQNRDGGWASFDRDNDKAWLTQVPFADHNAMIDPSTADITGRVLECLSYFRRLRRRAHPVVARALEFLRATRMPDGAWYGRWGVNYIYGTWQVLRGLACIGEDMTRAVRPPRRRAGCSTHQNRRRRLGREHRQLRRPDAGGAAARRRRARPPGR